MIVLFLHACIFRSYELSCFAAHKLIWILGSKMGWFVNSQKTKKYTAFLSLWLHEYIFTSMYE